MKIKGKFICFVLFLVFFSCSTEKNTVLRRGFHNLHAKYNGFFNANEIINQTYREFTNSRKENYNKVLPIYPLPNNEESKNWYSPMDTAAAKCELVIFRHRMPHAKKGRNRNKEWCKWIDDNWMTIAQTKFYKHEYALALKIFQYVESHYPTENSFYESTYWQAKVLIEMEAYDEAEEILLALLTKSEEQLTKLPKKSEQLKLKEKLKLVFNYDERVKHKEEKGQTVSEKLINKIYPTLADLYLRSSRKKLAIEVLEKATHLKFKKAFKTRLIYILAQLYHKDGNFKASNYYQQVVERNPDYEMAFQAKINRALSFSGGQTKAIKAQLLKMLKDDKNIEYFDQIYYALAEIAFKDNDDILGIENLQTSINYSKTNNEQKIKSMKRMGDWHFNQFNYLLAYHYYDSIVKIVPPKFEQQPIIDKTHRMLTKIYLAEQTILYNDSLIKICNMSEDERSEKIFEVVDAIEQEKIAQKENELLASADNNMILPSTNNSLNQTIFFWDQSMLERGKKEFKTNWGDRKLEDNWRRTAKNNSIISEDEFSSENEEPSGLYESILKNLPCNDPSKLSAMDDSILLSLFNLGLTHHYETENLEKATYYLEKAIETYLPKEKAVASAYELYRIYEFLNEETAKNRVKDLLITKFSKSKYVKLILSNDDLSDQQRELIKEKKDYQEAFLQYKSGNYELVIEECALKIEDSLNLLFCEYGLLKAYALGKSNSIKDSSNKELINTLKKVVDQCQGSKKGDQANSILKQLKVAYAQTALENSNWKFNYNPDTVHFFLLFAPKGQVDVNKAKNGIADFNMSSFSAKKLKTSNTFLNTSDQMVLVKMFKNADEAMDYYTAFKVNTGPVKSLKENDYFVLSPSNLKELYLEKNIVNYKSFFKDFYL